MVSLPALFFSTGPDCRVESEVSAGAIVKPVAERGLEIGRVAELVRTGSCVRDVQAAIFVPVKEDGADIGCGSRKHQRIVWFPNTNQETIGCLTLT